MSKPYSMDLRERVVKSVRQARRDTRRRTIRGQREFGDPMDATLCPVGERGRRSKRGEHVAVGSACALVSQVDRRAAGFNPRWNRGGHASTWNCR